MKKRPPFNQNSAIRGSIRRMFSRSPVVREVLMQGRREVSKYNKDGSLAKKPAVQYQCEVCNEWVSSTKMAVDHKIPVISVENGFIDWNTFVERLFCAKENLQRICDPCHDAKTLKERWERIIGETYQLLPKMESMKGEALKKMLQKFTPKKLINYPADIQKRITTLKEKTKKKK